MSTEASRTVGFGISPILQAIFLGPMALLLMLGLWLALSDPKDASAGWMIFSLMLPITAGIYALIRWQRLFLSAKGIRLRSVGATIETTWDNLERLYRLGGQMGLVTRSPMTGKGAEKLALYRNMSMNGAPLYDNSARQWLAEGRYVPLRGFERWVKSGKIQAEVRRHVPGLPGLEDVGKLPNVQSSPAQMRDIWLLIAICTGLVALTMLAPAASRRYIQTVAYGLLCAVGALRFGYSAVFCLKGRMKWLGVVYLLLALMLAMLTLVYIDDLMSLKKGAHGVPSHVP